MTQTQYERARELCVAGGVDPDTEVGISIIRGFVEAMTITGRDILDCPDCGQRLQSGTVHICKC